MQFRVHDKYSSTSFKHQKNGFNLTNLLPQKLSGTVVVKELRARADELGSTSGEAASFLILNLYIFLFCLDLLLFFLILFIPLVCFPRGFCDNVFPVTWLLCGLLIARAFTLYHTKKKTGLY